jgi:hypothetical protein
MSTLIEWIRNGNKFSDIQCETTTVVSVTDGFSVSNCSFAYLYRDKKLGKSCAYAFFTFYDKRLVRTFLRSKNCHLPRFDLELAHPQHAKHCLMRLKQPRVPITNGRAIRIPQCWTGRNFDLHIHFDEELENLNEFALYIISRYYPLISGEEIVLPPSLTMYLRVKRWWSEEILRNSKHIV